MRTIGIGVKTFRLAEKRGVFAIAALCAMSGLLSLFWGCAPFERFPDGYIPVRAELQTWQNQAEGFSLTLVSNPDRVQGFAEWGTLGIYGRIVSASKSGSSMSISLGDGGMNGVILRISQKKDTIEVRCGLPAEARIDAAKRDAAQHTTVTAQRVVFSPALRVSTAELSERQENGRDISIRLQYVTSTGRSGRKALDEALRRGKSVHDMAAFRRSQQEESPVVVYDQSAMESEKSSAAAPAQPPASALIKPPLVFEEEQYPVFVSKNILSVATQCYLFNGGVHGAASTDFDVIDLAAGSRLGPDDILKDGWRTELLPAIKAELLRQGSYIGADPEGNLKALGLFDADICAPEKVFVCMTGVGFEYDRYQIAPWAMGEYVVVLPWQQMKPYLKKAVTPF